VLIVKKRDTGKTNPLKEVEVTKRSSKWSDGAEAPCQDPLPLEPMVTLPLVGKYSFVTLERPIQ
jgi:hypothetical protein